MMKNLNRFLVTVLSVSFVFLGVFQPIEALQLEEIQSDGLFHVVDSVSGEDLDTFEQFQRAQTFFNNNKDNYENLTIVKDGVVYKAEYAIVSIHAPEACDANILYINGVDGIEGFTNGCYGKDAAYLSTDVAGEKVGFLLAGNSAWASIEDVDIIPIENITSRLTGYVVEQGILYHEIKGSMEEDNFVSIIHGGNAPAYLFEGERYYSYDGHYFYETSKLKEMLDDYRNESHENSVNPEDPYYDYFQFVSHRTLTNASVEDGRNYITSTMGVQGYTDTYRDDDKDSVDDTLTRSQFFDSAEAFWQYQYEYGANALMMMAISANESSFGRSSLSFTRNNIFGHAAYDSEEEAALSRYQHINNSIYSHAKYYISGSYSSPLKNQFHGSFFGNKSAGMNVNYTYDPYWGEKVASQYRLLCEEMQIEEENQYTLGIKTSHDSIYIYQFPENGAKVLYDSGKNADMAFVILGEEYNDYGDWYKVQSEATLNEDSLVDLSYDYDYANDYGYIKQSDIQIVIPGKYEEGIEYAHVTFDSVGGSFPGGKDSVTYALPIGSTAAIVTPTKSRALFQGWDHELDHIQEDTTIKADYRAVDAIKLISMPETSYEVNDRISLKNGVVQVQFTDGETMDVPLTSSMVSGFHLEEAGKQDVLVTYAGCQTTYPITVSEEKDTVRTEIKNTILDIIEQYQEKESFTDEEKQYLLNFKQKIDENTLPYLTHAQLRQFDGIIRKAIGNQISYVIEANPYNVSISGLSISVPLQDSLDKYWLFADTYRVRMNQGVLADHEEKMNLIAESLQQNVRDTFTISLRKNYDDFVLDGPFLCTIDKPIGADEGEVFQVLYYDSNDGDVEKCYTRQSDDSITFMGNHDGEFMLVSRRTSNTYPGERPLESVTAESKSFDLERALVFASIGGAVVLLVLLVLWLLLKRRKKVKVAKRRETIQEEEKDKPLPPVDTTQALHIFDTEVLRLDEIKELEKEASEDEAIEEEENRDQ